MPVWNPWHGCTKYSEGCAHCYVYRRDGSVGRDASEVVQTQAFSLPLRRGRDGRYKLADGETCYACMTSDFFLDQADEWRPEAWSFMRLRPGVHFVIITKRIERLRDCLPPDWGAGYPNVTVFVTMENQRRCLERTPYLLEAPLAHRGVICEPLLGPLVLPEELLRGSPDGRAGGQPFLDAGVTVGGESGPEARICDYDWVLSLREQCRGAGIRFRFKQTGACFRKDGRLYRIPRELQASQAEKAGISDS